MSITKFIAKLNRRNKAAMCATAICVGLILLLSHVGFRAILGITLLGMAFSWALGLNNRFVHWLFVVFGVILLLLAVLDGYFWPQIKAKLIQNQNSIIESDRRSMDSDTDFRKVESADMKQAKNAAEISEAGKTWREANEQWFKDFQHLREDEGELRRLQAEGMFRHVMKIDRENIAGGLLLLSAGLGLIVGIKPEHHI